MYIAPYPNMAKEWKEPHFGMRDAEETKYAACRWGFGQSTPPCVPTHGPVEQEAEQQERGEAGSSSTGAEQDASARSGCGGGGSGDGALSGTDGGQQKMKAGEVVGVEPERRDDMRRAEQDERRRGKEEEIERQEHGGVDEKMSDGEDAEAEAPRSEARAEAEAAPRKDGYMRHIPCRARRCRDSQALRHQRGSAPSTRAADTKKIASSKQRYVLNEYFLQVYVLRVEGWGNRGICL